MGAAESTPMLAWDEGAAESVARTVCELHYRGENESVEAVAAILSRPASEVRAVMDAPDFAGVLERVEHEFIVAGDALAGAAASTAMQMVAMIRSHLQRGHVDVSEIPALARPLITILAEHNKAKAKSSDFEGLPMLNVTFSGGLTPDSESPVRSKLAAATEAAEVVDVAVEVAVAVAGVPDAQSAAGPSGGEAEGGFDPFGAIDWSEG